MEVMEISSSAEEIPLQMQDSAAGSSSSALIGAEEAQLTVMAANNDQNINITTNQLPSTSSTTEEMNNFDQPGGSGAGTSSEALFRRIGQETGIETAVSSVLSHMKTHIVELPNIKKLKSYFYYNIIDPSTGLLINSLRNESFFQHLLRRDISNEDSRNYPILYERIQCIAQENGVSLNHILNKEILEENIQYGSLLFYALYHTDCVHTLVKNNISIDQFEGINVRHIKRGDMFISDTAIINCEDYLEKVDSFQVTNHVVYCCLLEQIKTTLVESGKRCRIYFKSILISFQKSKSWLTAIIPYRNMLKSLYVIDFFDTSSNGCPITECNEISIEDILKDLLLRLCKDDEMFVNQLLSTEYIPNNNKVSVGSSSWFEAKGHVDVFRKKLNSYMEQSSLWRSVLLRNMNNTLNINNASEGTKDKLTDQLTKDVATESKANASIDDDDGQTCSICLETWTISGEHRLCALKCGHLFGNSCIARWLRQNSGENRACPSCKAKACLRDVRNIFARKVVTADTMQEESLKQQLQDVKYRNVRLHEELTTMTSNETIYVVKLAELQKEIFDLRQRSETLALTQQRVSKWRYNLECNVEVCANKSCRVLTYNNRNNCFYVSLASKNNLFPGYAMRKIICENWMTDKLLHLHLKAIRDASYSINNDLLMTVSLDRCIKLVQGSNDMIVTTIQSQVPLWSCCWDHTNMNRLWVGGVGGMVAEYDVRQSTTAISYIGAGDVSPVASLTSVPGGIIACRLNSVTGYRKIGATIHPTPLSVKGTFTCVHSDKTNNDLLISCRPSSIYSRSRHIYCKSDIENFEFKPIATFEGSHTASLMSRSIVFSVNEKSYVSAFSEDESVICTWSVDSGKRIHSSGANDYVLDMTPVTDESGSIKHLATLSQKRLRVYQVTPCS